MLGDPVFQELHRRGAAKLGTATSPVVERLDVDKEVDGRLDLRDIGGTWPRLILKAADEETLRRRAVSSVFPLRLIEQIMPYPHFRA